MGKVVRTVVGVATLGVSEAVLALTKPPKPPGAPGAPTVPTEDNQAKELAAAEAAEKSKRRQRTNIFTDARLGALVAPTQNARTVLG